MAKTTGYQRLRRAGQPYTIVTTVPEFIKDAEGNITGVTTDDAGQMVRVQQLTGFTLEDRFIEPTEENPDGDWIKVWEPHDLGQFATFADTRYDAAKWRSDLVGNYPLAA